MQVARGEKIYYAQVKIFTGMHVSFLNLGNHELHTTLGAFFLAVRVVCVVDGNLKFH